MIRWLSAVGTRGLSSKQKSQAFTIVEVMISLAISSVILVSSIGVFSGRRESTEFSQTLYDLQSRLQSLSAEANASQLPNADSYTCQAVLVGTKYYARLTNPQNTVDSTATGNCIYMGKALQIIPGGSTIYIYPVLGMRTFLDSNNQVQLADQAHADPEPALDGAGGWLLVENYQILNGSTVKYAKALDKASKLQEQDLLSLFTNLNDASNTSGTEVDASSQVVTFNSTDYQPTQANTKLKPCIEATYTSGSPLADCTTRNDLTTRDWLLCIQSPKASKQALLTIKSTATGLVINTQQETCP